MSEYSRFAQYYDVLTQNIDYTAMAQKYDDLIFRNGGKKGILLDLGCGTGSVCIAMSRFGYDVIGVDKSQEMLTFALDKKFESGVNVQFLHQDMTKLDMYGTIDATISTLDSLNHLASIEQLEAAVKSVSLFTNPDGLFIFDVNTPYKHKNILANNTFVYDTEYVYCVWQNTYSRVHNTVRMDLDFFEKCNYENAYIRSSESFCEIAWETDEIQSVLKDAGFKVIELLDFDTLDTLKKDSQKAVFVCRKVN